MEFVGQKSEISIVLPVVESNAPKDIGIIDVGFDPGQNDFLIADQVEGFVDGLGKDPTRPEIRFGPNDEKGMILMEGVKTREVQISSIQYIEGTRLDGKIVEDTNIVDYSFCNMNKCRYRSSQIEKSMKFDGPLVPAESGPTEKRQTEVDRCRIEGINCVCEIQSEVFVAVETTGFGDDHLSKIGLNAPIAGFVGVGQVVSGDSATESHMIKPTSDRVQTRDDIAEAFP